MDQRYASFFDIDGTLVSFKTHEIPPIDKDDVMTCVEDSKAKGYSLIVVGRQDVAVLETTAAM